MNLDWIGLLTGTTSNQKFNKFSDKIDSILDQVAPIKKVKISTKKRFIEPWMTRSLALSSEKKLKLYKKTLSATCTEDEIKVYKSYRNMYNALKRKLRSEYYRVKCTEFWQNTRKLWSLINNMIKKVKNRGSIIPYLTVNGLRQYNPIKIANCFGDFCASLGHNLASKIIPGTTPLVTYLETIPRTVNSMIVRPTTVPEIDTLIKQLPNKTSYGHDKISNVMIKALRTNITYPLCHIFNASLSEGTFLDRMKMAEVIPLYKGKEMDLMINYRPISLLITLSKLLEKIMYTRLYRYLETQKLLYPSQYGFRTKRSCEQAIMELVGNILQSKNQNEHCASIFLDLSKAFDTLDHTILLQKLERYGIRGIALEWFWNYLKDRSLVAKITTGPNLTVKSESYNITYSAAQGSCLGPLLFIIFMNDIHLLPVYSSIILFADDTTIFNSHKSTKFLKYTLEHDLKLMIDWFKANALSLNMDKTVGIKFWDSSNSFILKVDDMPINMTNCAKFLGLYIDKNLTWHTHLSHLIEKLHTNRWMLSLGKHSLNQICLKNIYHSHIQLHISYGLSVWGSMITQQKINEIFNIQKQCVQIIAGLRKTDNTSYLFSELRILKIKDLIHLGMCKLGHNISHKHYPSPILNLFVKFGGRKVHRYPMQNKHVPNVQRHYSELYNKSFICKSITAYNVLPQKLKKEVNTTTFIQELKCHMSL